MSVQYHIVRILFYFATILFVGLSHSTAYAQETPRWARVSVAVADLRREPTPPSEDRDHDPLEESQLLYGERVRVLEEKGGWAKVAAVEQPEWDHHQKWEGYPGWMESAALVPEPQEWTPNLIVTAKLATVRTKPSPAAPALATFSVGTYLAGASPIGTKTPDWWKTRLLDGTDGWIHSSEVGAREALAVAANNPDSFRARLVQTASLFMGDPYYWGGRSAFQALAPAPPHTGIDCSGLTGLVYQANGYPIPRDAHEQWMNSRPLSKESLRPGDLIFLTDPLNAKRVKHVMLYIGDNQIIEAPGTGRTTRVMNLDERLKEGFNQEVRYGTYLSD